MIPMLTSKYYLIRIAKSKDATDLADAVSAYVEFKKKRLDMAHRQYCVSLKEGNLMRAAEAFFMPLY